MSSSTTPVFPTKWAPRTLLCRLSVNFPRFPCTQPLRPPLAFRDVHPRLIYLSSMSGYVQGLTVGWKLPSTTLVVSSLKLHPYLVRLLRPCHPLRLLHLLLTCHVDQHVVHSLPSATDTLPSPLSPPTSLMTKSQRPGSNCSFLLTSPTGCQPLKRSSSRWKEWTPGG